MDKFFTGLMIVLVVILALVFIGALNSGLFQIGDLMGIAAVLEQ